MKLLWIFVLLPAVLGQAGFGRSYLNNSRLCHKWNCINTKLGLPDTLPSKNQSLEVFKRVLPEGPWHDVITTVLDTCYGNRTRRYTNTCPGQALMHCVVDQMIENCPDANWKKDDACSSVTSLADVNYMFSQSKYDNLERNLPKERRPSWFLRSYFHSKCCNLPVMFSAAVLEECGFSSFLNYYTLPPKYTDGHKVHFKSHVSSATTPTNNGDTLKIVDFNAVVTPTTTVPNNGDTLKIVDFNKISDENDMTDPLDCCNMAEFIQPSWRSECDFRLTWGGVDRLVISNQTTATEAPVTTTTEKADQIKDIMLLPQSCEKETCVFRQLGIINETGFFDIDGYMKMLHNFSNAHPTWSKAKARVVTKCLVKPSRDYEADCDVNSILSCTLDVLTENCPYKRKSNICKHGKHEVGCQISSSKYRPRYRREICLLPELIERHHLTSCGLESLYRVEHVAAPPKPKKQLWSVSKYTCKDSTAQTKCIMNKMGILNKYNFMDYFKMKERIRQFTTNQHLWAVLLDVYNSAFTTFPLYREHCNSQKEFLNVVDAMLMTCPISMRTNTTQCNNIFGYMADTAPVRDRIHTKEQMDEVMEHYRHIFMPTQPLTPKFDRVIRRRPNTVKKPIYEFGLLNSKDAPSVKIINVKPVITKKPLVLSPVYLRPDFRRPYHGVLRSNPSWTQNKLTNAGVTTRIPTAHTVPTISSNLYSSRPIVFAPIPVPFTTVTDFPIGMLKPE